MTEKKNRDHFVNLSSVLGNNWILLGRTLRLDEATLENIEADHRNRGQREVDLQMLLEWMNTIGGTRTTLYNAVVALDNGQEIFERLLKKRRDQFEYTKDTSV